MKIWPELLNIAIHAPSPHNVQPWRVKIIDELKAELYIDSTRTLPKEDVTGSFIILAMGMFIEALQVLAERKGFRVDYELFHEPDWYAPVIIKTKGDWLIPFAKLALIETEPVENKYSEDLFLKRRTSRLHLQNEPLPDEAVDDLTNIAELGNQTLKMTTDNGQIERLMSLNTQALFEDLNAAEYHDEIVEWFRFSESESNERLDGLDYRCMNTPRLTFWMSARMSWMMKTPVLSSILAKIYRAQLGPIPTLGIISGGFWKPAEAIESGRFLMRFWLETARHNLYIHPFGNLVTNRKINAEVEKDVEMTNIWLIFKIGFSDIPPKSHRLPLEKVLIN